MSNTNTPHEQMPEGGNLQKLRRYLQQQAIPGPLQKSMIQIAAEIGCSNATVQRNLAKLRIQGVVDCIPPQSPNLPLSIIYKGETLAAEDPEQSMGLMAKIRSVINELTTLLNELDRSMQSTMNQVATSREDIQRFQEFQNKIVSTTQLPGNMVQIIVDTNSSAKNNNLQDIQTGE